MKRMYVIWIIVASGFVLLLSACGGEKSKEDVVSELEESMEDMSGYKAKAEMSMNTGQEEQKFTIDIWHKKEELYRVSLQNDQDEKGNQIILKNDDGVFVLTPALNKSFKFQSEWPDNSSQPYLYQSLVKDVMSDSEAEFETNDSSYIFKTKTNYQSNNNLPFQEIHFDKKTYTPVLVKVMDQDRNALVEVKFSTFEMQVTFEDDDFTMDKNMASGTIDEPVSGEVTDDDLTVVYPLYKAGAELAEKREVDLENGKRVILTFSGEKNFTLVEEKSTVLPTFSSPKEVRGDIVNLGHTVAALSNNTLEWSHDGVDFILASDQLTKAELIEVAQSVESKEVK
ncbi:outer membrane lipoprotein carrier protein LolA [Virgibacillus sp. C22-A2]|uniref:Outer membrane lipoprotein carrier protein LolA n=1 Tax=Virgibacillus tibetensis TaxID=3042313 RepID=A0ABU6KJW0_9BACI|nr:outer membrane lipoprotein carrier protein LolA [Virgibacillus sp. C22-A2]